MRLHESTVEQLRQEVKEAWIEEVTIVATGQELLDRARKIAETIERIYQAAGQERTGPNARP
jgi:Tat protein secretion system quality control protein TatD with DNase activity